MLEPMVLDVFQPDVQATHLFVARAFFSPHVVKGFGGSRWFRGRFNVCLVGLRWRFGSRRGFRRGFRFRFKLLEMGDLVADEPQVVTRKLAIGVRRQDVEYATALASSLPGFLGHDRLSLKVANIDDLLRQLPIRA